MTDREDQESSAETDALVRSLTASARVDSPPGDLGSRVLHTIAERQRVQRLVTSPRRLGRAPLIAGGLAAACLAIGVALWLSRRASEPLLTAEPAASASGVASARIPAPPPKVDPCALRRRATGGHGTIDDFEDGDDVTIPLEGRSGTWHWIRDNDGSAPGPRLLPVARPDARPGNRLAMHVRGERLRAWGASIELVFEPGCYDASAYDGLSLVARGPGRVYVTARQVDVVPADFGGTCERDCFNAHTHKLDLGSRWKEYRLRFSEFEQTGYGGRPLDSSRLHDVSVHVHADDTPYDFWVDDIKFLER